MSAQCPTNDGYEICELGAGRVCYLRVGEELVALAAAAHLGWCVIFYSSGTQPIEKIAKTREDATEWLHRIAASDKSSRSMKLDPAGKPLAQGQKSFDRPHTDSQQILPMDDGDVSLLGKLAERILEEPAARVTQLPPWFLYGAAMNATGIDALHVLADWPDDDAARLIADWRVEVDNMDDAA